MRYRFEDELKIGTTDCVHHQHVKASAEGRQALQTVRIQSYILEMARSKRFDSVSNSSFVMD